MWIQSGERRFCKLTLRLSAPPLLQKQEEQTRVAQDPSSTLLRSSGASAAAMLIFILPSAFYIKLVKKEPLKSMQKMGVSLPSAPLRPSFPRAGFHAASFSSGGGVPGVWDLRHVRQHDPHHRGLGPQRLPEERTLEAAPPAGGGGSCGAELRNHIPRECIGTLYSLSF